MLTVDGAQRIAALKLMAFDVDGILTDGRLWYADDGSEYKAFNARDGSASRCCVMRD